VQFDVAEKDRLLEIIQKEKAIYTLTNYILIGAILFIIAIALLVFTFLRRINKRNKQLLQAKEDLIKITEEQKVLKEQQLQNEIEFKESQLSALTLQMLQKIELLQELKEKLEETSNNSVHTTVTKIINKGISQDKEWEDFNTHFESINKNFYSKIKLAFPDISPNELKICALIKMNLSIKEMASILNISPDSVKTARYRLRKKLQLNTEDNLTEFILNLK
jgi:DNA-binding CsgD family transcriptional regulator